MVKITAEIKQGAVTRQVSITAPNAGRALELAGEGVLSYRILSHSGEGMEVPPKAA